MLFGDSETFEGNTVDLCSMFFLSVVTAMIFTEWQICRIYDHCLNNSYVLIDHWVNVLPSVKIYRNLMKVVAYIERIYQ